MKLKYEAWIQKNVPTYETAYGNCQPVCHAMREAFPELRLAYGNYYCLIWGERWHMWLATPDGEIVDPTQQQFPTQGGPYVERREEERPAGKCANCGELYYEHYDGTVCSETCGEAFLRSVTASL